ncbi:GntR family transcriptional regulator [Sphaerisporangium siamense]|uniref:GntR family transcriptional regulator n=1 Tax=Sphaerisporangium siamense TaxID=795645 RepID=A0A7W7G5W5_9ACTN|nr:GntR family transcriptional regulator [Sphaerisporangium siamense]MBB4698933.1 GntR family transcriptional regulator [Sphaerisporangium siamense]GII88542.1 GntR family transcriptional regulator [Sphaerisporangium siamense]
MDDPLHQRIADDLRRRIAAGLLAPGDPLPSESRLCAQWSASRGPVRQALAALRAEGLIGGGRGRPPVVRGGPVPQPFETLLSFTRWAESLGRVPGQRLLEIARRPARAEVADALEIDEGEPVVELLRLRLLDGRPAMIERTAFAEPVGRLLFDFDPGSGSVYAYLAARGVALAVARHVFDAVAADPLDSSLLGVPEGAPLLRELRRASGESGEPCEYSDDRYRPDLVTFTIENAQRAHPSFSRSRRPDPAAAHPDRGGT